MRIQALLESPLQENDEQVPLHEVEQITLALKSWLHGRISDDIYRGIVTETV